MKLLIEIKSFISEEYRYSIKSKKSFFITSKKLNLLPIKFINN
jgi:hypothetical protein